MNKINSWLKAFVGIASLFIFGIFVSNKLIIGARWGGGLFLGGVDNWLSGGSLYTQPDLGMTAGPVYSPGGLLVSLLARLLFGMNAETVIILIGGLFAIFTFWGYAKLVADKRSKVYWYILICLALFVLQFPEARFYLFEIHPDIPAIMCFVWGVLMLGCFINRKVKGYLIPATLFFLCSGLFKQNALFLFAGLGLFVLFTKKMTGKEKLLVWLSEGLAGIGVICIMLSIDGCIYNCVDVMASHHLIGLYEYCTYVAFTLFHNFFFLVLLIYFIILLLQKKIIFKSIAEEMWFCSAVVWFLFCCYGGAKEGSNSGNFEVALIAFMPFVLKSIEFLYILIKDYLEKKQLYLNNGPVLKNTIITMICSIAILVSSLFIAKNISQFQLRLDDQNRFSQWLSINFEDKNVAYNAKIYEILKSAKINKTTDLYISAQYLMGSLISDEEMNSISQKEDWDIIITTAGSDAKEWPETFSRFVKMDSNRYPELSIYGDNIEVFIKKD